MKKLIAVACLLTSGLLYAAGSDKPVSLKRAIELGGTGIRESLADVPKSDRRIAVLSVANSPTPQFEAYILDELTEQLLAKPFFEIADRNDTHRELMSKEVTFQQETGEVNADDQVEIGNNLGAFYIITVSMAEEKTTYTFRFTVLKVERGSTVFQQSFVVKKSDTKVKAALKAAAKAQAAAIAAEKEAIKAAAKARAAAIAAQKAEDERIREATAHAVITQEQTAAAAAREARRKKRQDAWDAIWNNDFWNADTRYHSLGISVGTAFATPMLIGTVDLTTALFPYTFFDFGCDFGFVHAISSVGDVGYQSYSPYTHFNAFVPFEEGKGGWYIGVGGGYLMSTYTYPEESKVDPVANSLPVFDVPTGLIFSFGHSAVSLNYIMRISTKTVGHKLSAGYAIRFGNRD
jgi:hypothetical protein